jgi:hypothetical protein
MKVMTVELRLNLPWMPLAPERIGELTIRRGVSDVLAYDDGITMQVHVLDPAIYPSASELTAQAVDAAGPGRVALVAGAVPVAWRPALREARVSFIDVAGTAEILWPRIQVSSRRFGQPVTRRRNGVPLQKGHALVAQELLIVSGSGVVPTISELARGAGVSVPTASRAVAQFANQGLLERQEQWRQVFVRLTGRMELAEILADRTPWPGNEVISGYVWGRSTWNVADSLSRNAMDEGIAFSVTGRAGASFLGILGTTSPRQVRCWAFVSGQTLTTVAAKLGLEPASREESNVIISADPWRIGVHRSAQVRFEEWSATIAHPIRVWCDLHGEERGSEFATQLWRTLGDAQRPGKGF